MCRLLIFLLFAGMLRGQQALSPERQIGDVETAILSRDLVAAYDAAVKLDDRVQGMARASRARDIHVTADQLLTWLPPSWDVFVFDQRAFVAGERTARPDVALMGGRLAGLRGGAVISALRGATVRAAAAGGSTTAPSSSAYFYFFDGDVNPRALGNPDLTILGRPFWRAGNDDWFTLARPDLLLIGSSRDLAAGILGRVLNGSSTRALPAGFAEWAEVQREAPLWGLRHFSSASDSRGVALSLDAAQTVELRCLCTSRPALPEAQFLSARVRNGLWVLRADGAEAGGALGSAFGLLGLAELPQ